MGGNPQGEQSRRPRIDVCAARISKIAGHNPLDMLCCLARLQGANLADQRLQIMLSVSARMSEFIYHTS